MAISVLIVEDDPNIRELLQLYLEKDGYAVTLASDGGQGLEKFHAIKPNLVLLDVMMPVMDGWAVCRAIRAEGNTPVIMLTAKGETDDKVTGLKAGADDYVTKPFEMKELLRFGKERQIVQGSLYGPQNLALVSVCANTVRFGNVKMFAYKPCCKKTVHLQFAALSYLLPGNRICVVFRGTDETVNGWQENFSMLYRFPDHSVQKPLQLFLFRGGNL